jgi:gluconate 2-dehydrogenase alpha chain
MVKSLMRERLWVFTMQGEDLPQLQNRVDLDPHVVDVWGEPAGRVTYAPHRHELVCSDYVAPQLEAIMRDAGAEWTVTSTSPPRRLGGAGELGDAPGSHHVMGTCRMGADATTSVCDPWQRLWDVENVVIADSSVFPTSAGYGPTLTLVALAIRAARELAGLEPLRSRPGAGLGGALR